jgi:predicted DCC family thiol-disulfide oxidoreductase YuxK
MKKLYILYDGDCGLCAGLSRWINVQPKFIDCEPLAAGSPRAAALFPTFASAGRPEELTVVSDEGAVYKNNEAWIMCLYALIEYRGWAMKLSRPPFLGLARQAYRLLSRNRTQLSDWMGLKGEENLRAALAGQTIGTCGTSGHR